METAVRSWLFTIARELSKIPYYSREGERLYRAMRNGNPSPGFEQSSVRIVRMPDRKGRKQSLALGPIAVLAVVLLAGANAKAGLPSEAVRTLAEDVLGAGSVTSVRISDDGSEVSMRWESPTFKPSTAVAATRELMLAEAQLATGTVMGQLNQINRIRFTILKKNQMLATGQNSRGQGVIVVFSPEMGGGTMKPSKPANDPNRTRGGEPSSEL